MDEVDSGEDASEDDKRVYSLASIVLGVGKVYPSFESNLLPLAARACSKSSAALIAIPQLF